MKNKNYAIRVINRDCKTCDMYRDEQGNTCAIGALAEAAGVRVPKYGFIGNKGVSIGMPVSSRWVIKAGEAIAKKFGLDLEQQQEIQNLNDSSDNHTPRLRRRAIVQYLKTL